MNSINEGIFDKLYRANENNELDNALKDKYLDSIDVKKNEEGKYIDAFGSPISFNGIMGLLRSGTKLNLSKEQQIEIKACSQNYAYFRRNYCKIVSKIGIQRPEPRGYQERLENELIKGEDVIIHFGRQSGKCQRKNTMINIRNNETGEEEKITVEEFHKRIKNE